MSPRAVFPDPNVVPPPGARTPEDALRSVSKYLYAALGPEWNMAFASAEGDFQRPFCRVNASAPLGSTPLGWHHTELRRSFVAVCFPLVMPDEERAQLEAARVEDLLTVGVTRGVWGDAYRNASNRAHGRRIPLWSFHLVSLDESIEDAEARDGYPRRADNDFMRVEETPSVGSMPDPTEDRAYVVTLDLRLSWNRSTAVLDDGPLVERVTPTPTP